MDLIRIARRVNDKKKKVKKVPSVSKKKNKEEIPEIVSSVLDPGVEYSFKVDFSLTVSFEGDSPEVSEEKLRRKLKSEMLSGVKSAAKITAADFGLMATSIQVTPIKIDSSVNDQMDDIESW
jgi:translation elongation factor EF-1beta